MGGPDNSAAREENLKRIAQFKKDVKHGVPGAKEGLREAQKLATELVRAGMPSQSGPQPCYGTGETWVRAGEWTFAAPSMLGHYIAERGYRPPQVFIDAVMGQPFSEPVSPRRWWQFWK